ncbi:MAG TPA: hypothetical protein VFI06_10080, partial [Chitinophagaceae bacterium]|nr:hypothetical protein [Chitinophagaceae bacterium]
TSPNPTWVSLTAHVPGIDPKRRVGINNIISIAIDPKKPRNIWAGAGGQPAALLKSTDGGDHWTLVGEGQMPGVTFINKVMVDPNGIVWVACDNALFASSDDGIGFTRITNPGFVNVSFDDIVCTFTPNGNHNILVGVVDKNRDNTNQSGIFMLKQGFQTYNWAKMPLSLFDIYGRPLGTNLINSIRLHSDKNWGTVASIGKLGDSNPTVAADPYWGLINVFQLENGSWQPKWKKNFPETGNDIQNGYVQPICIGPEGKIYGGGKGIGVSDGRGGEFSVGATRDIQGQNIHVDVHKIIYSAIDQLMYAGTDGGLVRFKLNLFHTSGVHLWESLNSVSLTNFLTESVAFNPFDPNNVLVGTQDNGLLHRSNNSWSYVDGNETVYVYYDPSGIAYFVDCSQGCNVVKISGDAGNSFPRSFTLPGAFFDQPLISFHTTQQGRIALVCNDSNKWPTVYETTNGFAGSLKDLKIPNTHDHFYTRDPTGDGAFAKGYDAEGIGFYIFAKPSPDLTALHRWFNPATGDHFYTIDVSPGHVTSLTGFGYLHQALDGYVYQPGIAGHIPVFRWYNPNSRDHFYTVDPTGGTAKNAGYISEGEVFRVPSQVDPGAVPFYRWYNHLHTPWAILYAGDILYVSVDDKIFRTDKFGKNWSCIWKDPSAIQSFCFDPANPSAIYVSTDSKNTKPKIMVNPDVSTNPGNFIDITGNLDLSVTKMVLYSKGAGKNPILYVATRSGIYKTTRINGASTSWELFGTGLPDTDIRDLQVNPVNHWLYVATYGRGVWNTIDVDQIGN